jgi:uncharacterized protein
MSGRSKVLAVTSLAIVIALGLGAHALAPVKAAPEPRTAAGGLYAVIYRPGPNWKVGLPMKDQDLRDHFFYLRDLNEKGVVAVAGPLGDDGGLVIMRATDGKAAGLLVSADPAVSAGIFVGEPRPFLPRIGGTEPLLR